MSALALGGRHRCRGCGCAFYDMGRVEPACPRCGRAAERRAVAAVPLAVVAEADNEAPSSALYAEDEAIFDQLSAASAEPAVEGEVDDDDEADVDVDLDGAEFDDLDELD